MRPLSHHSQTSLKPHNGLRQRGHRECTSAGNLCSAPSTTVQPAETTAQPEEAAIENVTLRVSGTPGTAYSGSYGSFQSAQSVNDTLGAEPVDYEIGGSISDILAVVFRKTQPDDEGTLRVEILVDGEVVAEDETSEELGVVNVTWSAQTGQIERRGPLD